MVDDFMLDDSIIKSKGNLGEDILNNIIRNLNIADEAIPIFPNVKIFIILLPIFFFIIQLVPPKTIKANK